MATSRNYFQWCILQSESFTESAPELEQHVTEFKGDIVRADLYLVQQSSVWECSSTPTHYWPCRSGVFFFCVCWCLLPSNCCPGTQKANPESAGLHGLIERSWHWMGNAEVPQSPLNIEMVLTLLGEVLIAEYNWCPRWPLNESRGHRCLQLPLTSFELVTLSCRRFCSPTQSTAPLQPCWYIRLET